MAVKRQPVVRDDDEGLIGLAAIDLDDVRGEVERAGVYAENAGRRSAEADAEVSRAKLALDVTKADLSRKARKKLLLLGEKVTERMIEEEVLLDPAYKVAVDAVIDAEERAEIVRSAAKARESKQRLMSGLSALLAREIAATGPLTARKGR